MKKRKLILVALSMVMSTIVWASDTTKTIVTKEVKQEDARPKGKAIVSVFANYNMAMQNGESKCGFQLERSFLGYQYSLGNGLELKAVMDIGKPSSVDDYHYVAYIKNAQVSWKHM